MKFTLAVPIVVMTLVYYLLWAMPALGYLALACIFGISCRRVHDRWKYKI